MHRRRTSPGAGQRARQGGGANLATPAGPTSAQARLMQAETAVPFKRVDRDQCGEMVHYFDYTFEVISPMTWRRSDGFHAKTRNGLVCAESIGAFLGRLSGMAALSRTSVQARRWMAGNVRSKPLTFGGASLPKMCWSYLLGDLPWLISQDGSDGPAAWSGWLRSRPLIAP